MKRVWPLLLIIASVIIIIVSCQKSLDHSVEIDLPEPVENVTASFSGRVLDERSMPVSGATVTAGTGSTSTDINGYFELKNATVNKNAGLVKIEKAGYFAGFRSTKIITSASNYVEVKLLPKKVIGNFAASSGGTAALSNGTQIKFAAGAIIKENGSAYSGTVNVSAIFIDPTATDFNEIIPGSLRGVTTGNRSVTLQSFGMVAVELSGSGGEKLQLATGKPATITSPIPSTLETSAPATIPLWSLDETTGIWKEEGSAVKQGNKYVGNVPHFSFWNFDAPYPLVNIEAVVKYANGNPLGNTRITIKAAVDTGYVCATGYTAANGQILGPVPSNRALKLFVYNACGNVVFTKDIAPLTANTNLGDIVVPNQTGVDVTISGTATTCAGSPVTNGYVTLNVDGRNFRVPVTAGAFSITVSRCSNANVTGSLIATDLAAAQQSVTTSLTIGNSNINAGNISACGVSTEQFINYTLNGTAYSIITPGDSIVAYINGGETRVQGTNMGTLSRNIYFAFEGTTTGTHNVRFVSVHNATINGTMNVVVTQYGNVSEFIQGSMSGNVKDSATASIQPFTCNFKVKRRS